MDSDDLVYLKSNVIAEPLIAGWYAWPQLIPPATCAMNVVGRHLKIMDSYIQAPNVHADAVKNPKMKGGPFMDYPEDRSGDIKQLKDQTLRDQRRLIELAGAIRELSELLKREAIGYGLDPLYERIPEPLRGYVDLSYDLLNQPSYRFFEPLMYLSEYHDHSLQGLSMYESDCDERPFILSTPRLPTVRSLFARVAFRDEAIDRLFRMRREAGPYSEIREALGIGEDDEALFRSFFTRSASAPRGPYDGDGMRIRYYGHACLVVETRDICIMSDPFVSHGTEGAIPRYTYADLPEIIDYAVITHHHQDHVLIETLLELRHAIRHVVVPRNGGGQLQDPSLKQILRALGFTSVIELDELDSIDVPGGRITGVPFLGEHADLQVRSKICHYVNINNLSVLFAADSCAVDPRVYQRVHDAVGDVDVLFLGMECNGAPLTWLYGPLLPEPIARDKDRSRRLAGCNFDRAFQVVECFRPREVYVYAMGLEPWINHIMGLNQTEQSRPITESNRLVSTCQARGIVAERLFAMKEIHVIPSNRRPAGSDPRGSPVRRGPG
jgi:L-ascorbate metabolism protein UlaG (beta-lactamase superfamily)